MKFIGKAFILVCLLAEVVAYGADYAAYKAELLAKDRDSYSADEYQRVFERALLQHITNNNVEAVQWLLSDCKVNVNCDLSWEETNEKVRPLTTALLCMSDDIKGAKELALRYNQSKRIEPRVEMVKLLLDKKADPDRPARHKSACNRPLGICLSLIMSANEYDVTQVYRIVRLLIEHGAQSDLREAGELSLLECIDAELVRRRGTLATTIRWKPTVDRELRMIVSERVNRELADGLPKFSRDLTKLIATYLIQQEER